jgi:hypothetical protein
MKSGCCFLDFIHDLNTYGGRCPPGIMRCLLSSLLIVDEKIFRKISPPYLRMLLPSFPDLTDPSYLFTSTRSVIQAPRRLCKLCKRFRHRIRTWISVLPINLPAGAIVSIHIFFQTYLRSNYGVPRIFTSSTPPTKNHT